MILKYKDKKPKISETAFIAESAIIIGDVEIGDESSVWFNAVIRADQNKIIIGNKTSIQDNVVIHVDNDYNVTIGDNVSVGHGVVLHGCNIENNVIIGMNSTLLNKSKISKDSIVGANALISEGKTFPEKSLILGVPGKTKRKLEANEIESITKNSQEYIQLTKEYRKLNQN